VVNIAMSAYTKLELYMLSKGKKFPNEEVSELPRILQDIATLWQSTRPSFHFFAVARWCCM